MTELKITATDMILRGAEAPAPIVDRRLDGRLLVAAPGKKNRWIVLDEAFVPAALAKRIKAPSQVVEERIVVPTEIVDTVIAQVEAWLVGSGQEQDAKRAAAAAKAAATRKAKAEAKAAAEREAKWVAEAPARKAAAAARAEAERARQAQWAEERRARELAAAAQRRAEDARMAQLRANRAQFPVANAPAVGDAFEVEGDEMWRSDRVLICESLGRSWMQAGVAVCYAYGRPATAEEAAAYHTDRPRSGHVVLRSDRAPAAGDRFRLRDGTEVVCTAVGRPYRVDESLDEDYTSFYSSELWEQTVVRVDYEYVDAPAAPASAMVAQPVQQQQACAAPTGRAWADKWTRLPSRVYGDSLLGAIAAEEATVVYRSHWYRQRALPVVRVEGERLALLGWAENEAAAAAVGAEWEHRSDVAVRVLGPDGPVAFALLGAGSDDDGLRLFQPRITAVDGDGAEVDECDERAARWIVGDGYLRWTFDGHNPACRFAELCEGFGFVPRFEDEPARDLPAAPAPARSREYLIVKRWRDAQGNSCEQAFPVAFLLEERAWTVVRALAAGTYPDFYGPADRERHATIDVEAVTVPVA